MVMRDRKNVVSKAKHTIHSMLIQKSNMRRATQAFPTFGWQSHNTYPSLLMRLLVKFPPQDAWSSAYLFEYTMVVNHGLLDEDRVFWFLSILTRWTCLTIYCVIALCITVMPACRVRLSLHLLISAYPLLGAYLLNTYTYKCMHFLTRVYSILCSSSFGSCWRFFFVCHFQSTLPIASVQYSRGSGTGPAGPVLAGPLSVIE